MALKHFTKLLCKNSKSFSDLQKSKLHSTCLNFRKFGRGSFTSKESNGDDNSDDCKQNDHSSGDDNQVQEEQEHSPTAFNPQLPEFIFQDIASKDSKVAPIDPASFRKASNSNYEKRAKYSTKTPKSPTSISAKHPGRHLYHEECECVISHQIHAELNAGFAYLSMACYFGQTDVALPGCQGFFLKMYEEELGHAMKFIEYQLMRGGTVKWFPIHVPDSSEFNSIIKAFSVSTEMEKLVKEKLQCASSVAERHQDLNMVDLIDEFLKEQNLSICEMARLQIRAKKMCSDATGEYLFDKELFRGWVKPTDKKAIYK